MEVLQTVSITNSYDFYRRDTPELQPQIMIDYERPATRHWLLIKRNNIKTRKTGNFRSKNYTIMLIEKYKQVHN